MYDFTVRKFSSLPVARQHKKCAELIRRLYEKALKQEKTEHELALYNQLMQWMQLPSLEKPETQQLSDRYHTHLKQAGLSKKEHHLLPSIRKGDRKEGNPAWPIDIYLDRLRSAHNVGSILRTVEALALGDVYFSADTPFIDHKQVQDTAMGTHEWVQCHRGVELQQLRKPILIMETSPEAISLYDYVFPESFTLVVGNEEYGCSEDILRQGDALIEIPLRGRKNSLNVANAFAMAASEIQRQRMLLHGIKGKT